MFTQKYEGSCDFFLFFLITYRSNSHSPGPNKSIGTKIFKKLDQKVGQKGSLRKIYIRTKFLEPF